MLQVSTWVRAFVVAILIGGILVALPNALPDNLRAKIPSWLPSATTSLGLDLQGGSYLLLEVELDQVQKDQLESLLADIRIGLRHAHIGYTDLAAKDDTVSVHIRDASQFDAAKKILDDLNPVAGGSVLAIGTREYDVTAPGDSSIVMHLTDAYKKQTQEQVLNQSIEVVRRRIDALGTREPTIERQGDQRILVQVPGLQDPEHLKAVLGKTAKMTFQLVDESADLQQAMKGIVPIGDEVLPQENGPNNTPQPPIVVQRRVMVDGNRLSNAGWTTNQQTNEVVVTFRFDTVGAREFGDVTKDNVNRRFAIVLDKKVISAPVIREAILGGSGEISGNFTSQSAADLSALLRAGALPAPLKVIEERTVGAELGAGGPHPCGAVHGGALRAVRLLRRHRAGARHRAAHGGANPVQRDPDAARHRGHRAHHGHGRGRERPDL